MCRLIFQKCLTYENKLDHGVSHQCASHNCYRDHNISPMDVECTVRKPKANKVDINLRISLNHLINSCKQLFVPVSLLLNAMLLHSYVPDKMCLVSLVSIPNDGNKSLSDCNYYRSKALSSISGKIFDNVYRILIETNQWPAIYCSIFQKNHSTAL